MIIKKLLTQTLFFFVIINLNAQNRFVADLENRLESNSTTSEKFSIYGKLIEIYHSEHQYETAADYNRKLLQLAKKQNNNLELCKAYVFAGIILNNQELYDKVSPYIDSANTVALKSKDPLALAYVSYLRAYQDNSYDDNRKVITHIQKTFSLLEKTKGDIYLEFKLNYLLYGIYTEWNDLKNSEKYAKRCIEIAQKTGNKNDLSNAYSAMAVAYTYQYEESNNKKDLDKVRTVHKT